MDLYIVRHAVAHKRDADRWPDDSRRPLTPRGEECFRRAAAGITRLVPEVEVVLSSHFVRAWRTAELLEQTGWPEPKPFEELEPECSPREVLHALAPYTGLKSVALVGHRPGLHELASHLLTGDASGARVQIKKGGVVRLSFDGPLEPGAGYLEWSLTPKALRAIG